LETGLIIDHQEKRGNKALIRDHKSSPLQNAMSIRSASVQQFLDTHPPPGPQRLLRAMHLVLIAARMQPLAAGSLEKTIFLVEKL
jgi:hypothetical protein